MLIKKHTSGIIKIGITGQSGFIGTHLFNFLSLQKNVECVPFKDQYFQDKNYFIDFVTACDAIVHLAAMNRHENPQVIYDTNLKLVQQLIEACEQTGSKPHILFASSIQEEQDNLYGKSKKKGRELLIKWAEKNNTQFTGLIIPNVFGPFGQPNYNSVIATFCHQLTHNKQAKIQIDGKVRLIYVGELVSYIFDKIKVPKQIGEIEKCKIPATSEIKVSKLLKLLEGYKENYFNKGTIPNLSNEFEKNLFNTFLCYIDHKSFFPFYLKKHSDNRGSFVELVKLSSGGQVSFSSTVPGITRGNHYHTRKAERFAVIKGKARIQLRKIGTDKILNFELDGDKPSFVDMPIWHTHNITNVGKDDLYTVFWINEHYCSEDDDTFYEKV